MRIIGKIVKALLWIVGLLIVAAAIFLALRSPGKATPILDASGNVLEGSVSEIVFTDIGGVQQGMIIRGRDVSNPVLLFVHGGPGSPEYPMTEKGMRALEEDFTIVWWDQRGAGMSYNSKIPAETMTLEQFIEDTAEVSKFLMARFGQEKIYLMGHSWGSYLGAYTVQAHPELYHAFISVGQVADQLRSEQLAYDYMEANGSDKLRAKLQKFTIETAADLGTDYMTVRSTGMNELGIGMMREMKSMFGDVVMPILLCREYTFGQKMGYVRGMTFSQKYLWDTVTETSLFEAIPAFEVPVYMLQGEYDYQTSYVVAKEYFDALTAPTKEFFTFENSAHSPMADEPERFAEVVRGLL